MIFYGKIISYTQPQQYILGNLVIYTNTTVYVLSCHIHNIYTTICLKNADIWVQIIYRDILHQLSDRFDIAKKLGLLEWKIHSTFLTTNFLKV